MLTATELLRSFAMAAQEHQVRVVGGDFGKAFWCVGPELENNGVRADVAAWYPWVDTRGAMRCLSEWTEAFLRDGGVARTAPVLSGLRPSSAMAVWPGRSQF